MSNSDVICRSSRAGPCGKITINLLPVNSAANLPYFQERLKGIDQLQLCM